ncbi:hypothetical protein K8I28_15010 [bacterium]|nr:hypothetical protein [bacterium]
MQENRYELAGWLTIAALALMIISNTLNFFSSLPKFEHIRVMVLPVLIGITLVQSSFTIFGVIWFRRMLNRELSFHNVDNLITAIIIGVGMMSCIGIYMLTVPSISTSGHLDKAEALAVVLPGLIAFMSVGFPLAIVGIIYGVKLLKLEDDLFGYKKPLAITYIIGSSLLMTFFLAPVGVLVLIASDVFQALVLLEGAKRKPELEFV